MSSSRNPDPARKKALLDAASELVAQINTLVARVQKAADSIAPANPSAASNSAAASAQSSKQPTSPRQVFDPRAAANSAAPATVARTQNTAAAQAAAREKVQHAERKRQQAEALAKSQAVDAVTLAPSVSTDDLLEILANTAGATTDERQQTVLNTLRTVSQLPENIPDEIIKLTLQLAGVVVEAEKQELSAENREELNKVQEHIQTLKARLNPEAPAAAVTVPPSPPPRTDLLESKNAVLEKIGSDVGKLINDFRERKQKLSKPTKEFEKLEQLDNQASTWYEKVRERYRKSADMNNLQAHLAQIDADIKAGTELETTMRQMLENQQASDPSNDEINNVKAKLQQTAGNLAEAVAQINDLQNQLKTNDKPSAEATNWLKRAGECGQKLATAVNLFKTPLKFISRSEVWMINQWLAEAERLLTEKTQLEKTLNTALEAASATPSEERQSPSPASSPATSSSTKTELEETKNIAIAELQTAHNKLSALLRTIAKAHFVLGGGTSQQAPLNPGYKKGNRLFDSVDNWANGNDKVRYSLQDANDKITQLQDGTRAVTEQDIQDAKQLQTRLEELTNEGKYYQYLNPMLDGRAIEIEPLQGNNLKHVHDQIDKNYRNLIDHLTKVADSAVEYGTAISDFTKHEKKVDELIEQLHRFLDGIEVEREAGLTNESLNDHRDLAIQQIENCIGIKENLHKVKSSKNVAYYSEYKATVVNTQEEAQNLITKYLDGAALPIGSIITDPAFGALSTSADGRKPQYTDQFNYRVIPYTMHVANDPTGAPTQPIRLIALQTVDKSKGIVNRTDFHLSPADYQRLASLPPERIYDFPVSLFKLHSCRTNLPNEAALDAMIAQINTFQEKNPNKAIIHVRTNGMPESCVRAIAIYCEFKGIKPIYTSGTPKEWQRVTQAQLRAITKKMALETDEHRQLTYTHEQAVSGKKEKEMQQQTVLPEPEPPKLR